MAWTEDSGVSIRYAVEGGGAGPAVVLMHEMGGTLESWDEVVPALTAAGHRVLRYDQRGCGLSEKTRGAVTAKALTDDLESVLAAAGLPGPYHLVAVAASAVQALMFADRRPADVASQTLCNPALGVAPDRARTLADRAALTETGGMRVSLPATLDRSYPQDFGDPDAYRRYRGRYLANDPVCFAHHNRALADCDVSALPAGVRCPTMVVAGRFDQVRPPAATAELASRIPGARLEYVDSGHMMPAQAPVEVGEVLLDFLGTVGRVHGTAGGRTCG